MIYEYSNTASSYAAYTFDGDSSTSTTSPPSFLYTYATCSAAPLMKAAEPVYIPNGNAVATKLVLPVEVSIIALVCDFGFKLIGTAMALF